MDLALSLMPIKLIRNLSRSTAEKVLIGFLMSLGLVATAILCAKMSTFLTFGSGDALQATVLPSTYAILENIVMIIACSLPCLKSPAEWILKRFGILKEHHLTHPSCVNAVTLATAVGDESDARPKSPDSDRFTKDVTRIDSVALNKGSVSSSNRTARDADHV